MEVELGSIEDGERHTIEADGIPVELHRDGAAIRATVLLCRHQGCVVAWDGEGYACPCHGGYYSADRKPKLGPPRRPLRELEVRVEGGIARVEL